MDNDLTTRLLDDSNKEEVVAADPLFIGDIDATVKAVDDEPVAIQVNDDDDDKESGSRDDDLPGFILDPQEVFNGQDYTRGERQPNTCRDAPFALLWYAQLIVIVVLAAMWGIPALTSKHHHAHHDDDQHHDSPDAGDDDTYSYAGLIYFTLISGALTVVLSGLTMIIFTQFGRHLIQLSLLFSVFASLGMAVLAAIEGNLILALLSIVGFLVGCCYYFAVSDRIPFAAANLNAGVTAIRKNGGVVLIAYLCVALVFVFSTIWTLALIGIADKTTSCADDGSGCDGGDMNEGLVFVMLVSLFWSQQVISNVVHCTVAGVVGTFWFAREEASSFCSPAVTDSFVRSTTTSFGSICFGSLLTAVIKALRQIVQNTRNENRRNDNGILLCLAECILGCLESIMLYFNKYAFIYVGLYGYDYLSAGRNVLSLFDARGWTVIINDDMVVNCLQLSCLILGCLSGCAGMLISVIQGGSWLDALSMSDNGGSNNLAAAFLIAFILGLIISSVLVGVIDSAVSTVIVCFAEAPSDLHRNHPEMYEEMVAAWRKVYPNDCGF